MCVLKVFGPRSFKDWAGRTGMPVFSVYDAGEHTVGRRVAERNRVSFDVSDREWDDFAGQVADAIAFLRSHADELARELPVHQVELALLDFALWSRLDGRIANQSNHLPAALVTLAGGLGLAIGMSVYARDAFGLEE